MNIRKKVFAVALALSLIAGFALQTATSAFAEEETTAEKEYKTGDVVIPFI